MSRDPAAKALSRGASHSKTGLFGQLQGWWAHHMQSARNSFKRLLAAPLQTLMTALVVAIAMALPATLMVVLNNIERMGEHWDSSPKITSYLHLRAQPQAIEQLQQRLKSLPQVQQLHYISADQALQEFQQHSGFGDVLQVLDENPLPPTLIITPTASAIDPEQLQGLVDQVAAEAIVEQVQIDLDWVRRMQAFMALGQKVVTGLALLLSLGVLLALGNTIRLAIENRRDEIVIIKLVGGTDGFVRRPFLYTGAWYGLFGGVLACIVVSIGFGFLSGPVSALASSYHSDFRLRGLGLDGVASLLIISAMLGLMGAWLAVSRHLSEIEPK